MCVCVCVSVCILDRRGVKNNRIDTQTSLLFFFF